MTRYLSAGLVHRFLPATFPYGTFLVNLSGCFAIGALAAWLNQGLLGPGTRLFLMVGLLGGITTFSSFFGYETLTLVRDGSDLLAGLNVVGQVVLGLACVWAGSAIAEMLV
jgi:CrcB protein